MSKIEALHREWSPRRRAELSARIRNLSLTPSVCAVIFVEEKRIIECTFCSV